MFGPLGSDPMAYALIFPLSQCISQTDFQLPSTVQGFRGAELHHSTGAIPAEGEEALAAALLVPGTICCDCVVTSVLWPLSARGDRAMGPSCAAWCRLWQRFKAVSELTAALPG